MLAGRWSAATELPEQAQAESESDVGLRERCTEASAGPHHLVQVESRWQLERLWEIINRYRENAVGGAMVAESLDLSFVEAAGICQEKIGNIHRRAHSPSPSKVEEAIYALISSRELPAFDGERTEFPEHRQLSLEICGWKFSQETLEAECQDSQSSLRINSELWMTTKLTFWILCATTKGKKTML